ncbi:MAG: fibronectin type III domain-containing protein [Treponema sp.]|jgi:hypothetical protein|nr:fibronectin type III domain-containing protein [Treponema sp.]
MKRKQLLSGILGILLVFGVLVCTACPTANVNTVNVDNDNDNDSSIIVSSPPSGVGATVQSSSSIRISWNAVSGATSYKVYRSTSVSGSYTLVNSATTTSYTDTELSAGTTYYYKVSAVNSAGESEQSSSISGITRMASGRGEGLRGNGFSFFHIYI